jgi:hypothetical protein
MPPAHAHPAIISAVGLAAAFAAPALAQSKPPSFEVGKSYPVKIAQAQVYVEKSLNGGVAATLVRPEEFKVEELLPGGLWLRVTAMVKGGAKAGFLPTARAAVIVKEPSGGGIGSALKGESKTSIEASAAGKGVEPETAAYILKTNSVQGADRLSELRRRRASITPDRFRAFAAAKPKN